MPKSGRKPVWESALRQRLPHLFGKYSQLEIFNHTDLMRGGQTAEDLESVRAPRRRRSSSTRRTTSGTPGTKGDIDDPAVAATGSCIQIAEGKTLFLLTATPVNNRLTDLQHMIELFSRGQADYFRTHRWASIRCRATSARWRRTWRGT